MPIETLRAGGYGSYSDWDGSPPPSANILQDPDTFNWPVDAPWRALNNNVSPEVIIVFDAPSDDIKEGLDLQTYKCLARPYSSTQTGSPKCRIELWENIIGSGWEVVRAGPDLTFSGTGYELKSFTWDVAETTYGLSSRLGFKFVGLKSGGSPGSRNTTDLAAVEWVANIVDPVILGNVNFSALATLQAAASEGQVALLSGVATISANPNQTHSAEVTPSAAATITADGTRILPPSALLSGAATLYALPPLQIVFGVGAIPDQGKVDAVWIDKDSEAPYSTRRIDAVTYSPKYSKFLIMGQFGVVYSSIDKGVTWTNESGTSVTRTDLLWCEHSTGQPAFIICSSSGTILRNVGGLGLWTPVGDFATNINWNKIAHGNDVICICGTNGWIARSEDAGITFVGVQPSGGANNNGLYAVAYSPVLDMWVTFATSGDYYTSIDGGLNWTQRDEPTWSGISVVSLVWAKDQFVGCANGNRIVYSSTGTSWTVSTTASPLPSSTPLLKVAYNEDYDQLYITDGFYNDLITSYDGGATWSEELSHTIADYTQGIAYGDDTLVLVGGQNSSHADLAIAPLRRPQAQVKLIANGWARYTGTTIGGEPSIKGEWVEYAKPSAISQTAWPVIRYGGNKYLVRVEEDIRLSNDGGKTWAVEHSFTWSASFNAYYHEGSITYGNGYWLAIAEWSGPLEAKESTDGITWSSVTFSPAIDSSTSYKHLLFSNGNYIITWQNGFYYSTDRVNWTWVDLSFLQANIGIFWVRWMPSASKWVSIDDSRNTFSSNSIGSGWVDDGVVAPLLIQGFVTSPYEGVIITQNSGDIWRGEDATGWTDVSPDQSVGSDFYNWRGTWNWFHIDYNTFNEVFYVSGRITGSSNLDCMIRSLDGGTSWEFMGELSLDDNPNLGYINSVACSDNLNNEACTFTVFPANGSVVDSKWGHLPYDIVGNGANLLKPRATVIPPNTTRLNANGSITANGTIVLPSKTTMTVSCSLASKLTKLYKPIDGNTNISILPSGVKLLKTGKHHGPFISSKGELYIWAYDSNQSQLRAYKAQDRDSTWSYVAGSGITWNLSTRYTLYQGPVGTDYEDKIYLAWQLGDAFAHVKFLEFDMFSDNITVAESFIKITYNASSARGALYPCVSIAHRYVSGVYQIVVAYNGYPTYSGGTTYERVDVATLVPGSTWVTDISIDPGEFANNWVMNNITPDRNNDGYIHVWHQEDDGDVSSRTYWHTLKDDNTNDPASYYSVQNWHKIPLAPGEFEPMGFCTSIKQATSDYTVRALFSYDNTGNYRTGNVFHTETDVNDIVDQGTTGGSPISRLLSADSITEEPDLYWNAFTNCIWDGDKAPGTDEEEHYVAWIAKNTDTLLYTKDTINTGYLVSTSHRVLVAPDDYVVTGARIPVGLHDVFAFLYNESGTVHWDELRLSSYDGNSVVAVGNAYTPTLIGTRVAEVTFSGTVIGEGSTHTLIGTTTRTDVSSGTLTLSSDTTVTCTGRMTYASAILALSSDTTVTASTSMPVTGSLSVVGSAEALYWQGVISAKESQQPVPVEILVSRNDGDKEGDPIVDPLLTSTEVALSRGRAELDRQYLNTKFYEVDILYRNDLRLGQLLEVHDLLFNEKWFGKLSGISHKVGPAATPGTWTSLSIERHIEYVQPVYKQFIVSTFPAHLLVSGISTQISAASNISTTPSTLVLTPTTAEISIGTAKVINTTPATLTVTEQQATIRTDTGVPTTPATLNITAPSATIIPELESRISTTPQSLVVTGQQATIRSSIAVITTPAVLDVTGVQAAISIPTLIDTTATGLTITTFNASIRQGVSIPTTPTALTVTGQQATLRTDINVPTTPATLVATGQQAVIQEGSGITTTPATITLTGISAVIVTGVSVTTTPVSLTITKQPATIQADTIVNTAPDSLTVTPASAVIVTGGITEVVTTPAAINFFELDPLVSRVIETEILTTPANLIISKVNALIVTDRSVTTTPANARLVEIDPLIHRD